MNRQIVLRVEAIGIIPCFNGFVRSAHSNGIAYKYTSKYIGKTINDIFNDGWFLLGPPEEIKDLDDMGKPQYRWWFEKQGQSDG